MVRGRVRRAYDGARSAVFLGLGAGAVVGLATGIPIILCAGAGANAAMVVGALRALARR